MKAHAQLPTCMHIGLQKAGSTYLYNLLATNPHVTLSPLTEVNFFNGQFEKGIEWYAAQFPSTENAIDISPTYFKHGKDVAARIAQTYGERKNELRFVLLLRNPIHYVHSHYHMHQTHNWFANHPQMYPRIPESFSACIQMYPEYLKRGKYAALLSEWSEYFKAEQFCILFFEDFITDEQVVLKRMCEFWQVPYVPMAAESVSQNRALRGKFVKKMRDVVVRYPSVKNWLKKSSVLNMLLSRYLTVSTKERLDPKVRAELIQYYEPDVQLLKQKWHIPRTPWEDFEH